MEEPRIAKDGELVEMQVPGPEDSLFLHPHLRNEHITPVMRERHELFDFDRVEYPATGGIHLWLKGYKAPFTPLLYPIKGFPYPEALAADNIVKRILIGQIRLFAKFPISALYLLTKRGRTAWVKEFVDLTYPIMNKHMLDPIRYNPLSRELLKIVPIFATEIGVVDRGEEVTTRTADALGHIVAAMIEHDDGYRYRIEDLFGVTSKEAMLKNPAKELTRMVEAVRQRDPRLHMTTRFHSIAKLLKLAFFFPGFKRAFKKAIASSYFMNMQMDDADIYHTLRKDTYDFGGRSIQDRLNQYYQMHNGVPPIGLEMN